MKITYDPKVNAAYFRFLEGDYECTTVRVSEDVAVNIAPGGKVVGIEVLDASESWKARQIQMEIQSWEYSN